MVLDHYDEEEREELMIQISPRARDIEDSEKYEREQCEECGADVCVSDDYAMEIDTDKESVEADPEDISHEDMEVFLCPVCGMKLIKEKSGSQNGIAM